MKALILCVIICLGSYCVRKPKVIDRLSFDTYKVLKVNRPKHYYLDLQNIRTDKTYRHVYVSKHCNTWRLSPPGKLIKLKRIYWTLNGRETSDFTDLHKSFCE